jgi:transposase
LPLLEDEERKDMIQKTDYLYIGMDIHKETHTAVLMTYMEERIGELKIENNINGFKRLQKYVEKHRKQLTPMFGLEDVTHYGRNLAIYLLEKEYPVKEVNSALSYMERMSYPSTKKNDTWDSQCICSVLMRRYELLPDANPQDYYWTMKHLVNHRNALVKTNTMLLQQFHDQIQNSYPSYKKFFHEIDCKTSLAFYEQYPSPKTLEKVTDKELGEFLRIPSHNACSTKRASKILELVCQDAVKERDYQFGRDAIIQSIVRNMRFNGEEIEKLEEIQATMLKVLNCHLETIPGISMVTACALIGNIGDITRFKSADKLANFAGVAPICHSSAGKGKNVQNKTQGNRELYNVLYFLAVQQVYVTNKGEARNPVLRAYFEYKISERKTKIQALICIMRRLIRVIYSMMKYKTEYKMPELKEKMIS